MLNRDNWWLSTVSRYKPVSAHLEPDLSREELITTNLHFAFSVAKRYVYSGIPLEDLIQYANMGLCRAAESYDSTKVFKFITYAISRIVRLVSKG